MTKELQLRGTQFDGKKKRILLIGVAAVLGVAILAAAASVLLQVDAERAREIARSAVGGGEIVGQSIDQEGLWREYSFQISNNGTWYEVELDGFGRITELDQDWEWGAGHWD